MNNTRRCFCLLMARDKERKNICCSWKDQKQGRNSSSGFFCPSIRHTAVCGRSNLGDWEDDVVSRDCTVENERSFSPLLCSRNN